MTNPWYSAATNGDLHKILRQ